MLADLCLFAVAFGVSAAVPGPDTLLIVQKTSLGGARSALPYAVGIVIAKLAFLSLAVLGVAAALAAVEGLLFALKIAGGAYLIVLGVKVWRARAVATPGLPPKDEPRGRALKGVLGGVVLGAANGQALFFYVALVPQVVGEGTITAGHWASLCLVLLAVFALVVGAYMAATVRLKRAAGGAAPPAVRRVAGGVLVVAGAAVVVR